jgi:hypothetical protein
MCQDSFFEFLIICHFESLSFYRAFLKVICYNRTELALYEAAERFLNANLDGKTLHIKEWKKEASELTAEKDKLYHEYKGLKEGVRQIGVVRRSVEHILDNAEKMEQSQQQRWHEIER